MLQQSNERLETELLKLRAEVKAEREWLEGQLDHQVSTHQQQQSELRDELACQRNLERRSKVLLREQLVTEHESVIQQLRTQMELQTKSLEDRVTVHMVARARTPRGTAEAVRARNFLRFCRCRKAKA